MHQKNITRIEKMFRKQVQKDSRVRNACLLIDSDKTDIHLNIAEGKTGDFPAHPGQPNYMASVGKLFTATLISILREEQKLNFNDSISKYLDEELLAGLHVYKGRDYSHDITIRHLLTQTSGLYDNFWPLLEKILEDKEYELSPREAVIWGKKNLKASFPPGKKAQYTDTNYHLLGLIVENITGKPFHEVLRERIFQPLGMKHSYMLHYSEPIEKCEYPTAHFSIKGNILNDYKNFAALDYSGGGVVAPNTDLLIFMKALVCGQIITNETLQIMKTDSENLFPTIDYGYGIWMLQSIPLILPEKYFSWGCVGATGAFMFYHPDLETFLIGTFNDVAYKTKGLKFMMKVLQKLYK